MRSEIIPIDLEMISKGLRLSLKLSYDKVYCATGPRLFRLMVVHDDKFVTSWRAVHQFDLPTQIFDIPSHVADLLISDTVANHSDLGLAVGDDRIRLLLGSDGEEAELSWRAGSQAMSMPDGLGKMVRQPHRSAQIPYGELDEVLGRAMDELTRLVDPGTEPPLIVAVDFAPLRLSIAGHDMTVADLQRRYFDLRRFVHCMDLLIGDTVTVAIEEDGESTMLVLDGEHQNWKVQCSLVSVKEAEGKLTYKSANSGGKDVRKLQETRLPVQTVASSDGRREGK
jgi:hypothetical protein